MKKISDSPCINDIVLFDIDTPNAQGLYVTDPHSIDKVTICFIERDYGTSSNRVYESKYYDLSLQENYETFLREAHEKPTQENIDAVTDLRKQMRQSAITTTQYYREAVPVWTIGNRTNPATQYLTKKELGKYQFKWEPAGMRAGSYIISWTYRMEDDSQPLTLHQTFVLGAEKYKDTNLLHRYTPHDKYITLLQRYTPRMYNYKLNYTDVTPLVLKNLNKSIAAGFTMLEDFANQLMDVYDPNTTHEAVLPLLANMFNLKFKSMDVAKWRRQIKQAIPLFKRKGTFTALKLALDQAGIKLNKITRLWQVVSQYIRTDGFIINNYTETKFIEDYNKKTPISTGAILGELSYFPIDKDLKVGLRPGGTDKIIDLPADCIRIIKPLEATDKLIVIWEAGKLNDPIYLFSGDVVTIEYKIQKIPEQRKGIENYIQSLPLADNRDETKQFYPLKNWNIRLIEEDDPFFDVVIPTRHPSYDPVVYGKIRTTFLYSEKVFNMDTYDGSLRDSNVPCDIDKDFIDSCSYCQSSQFNIDIEAEELSNEKILEIKEVVDEYSPFHAILRKINVMGAVNDFIIPPTETIESYVTSIKKDSLVVDFTESKENISYEIEWADGSKEKGEINDR